MQISVVILTRNEEERIGQTLESLLSQRSMEENEIVVVDGLSSDNTRKIVKSYMKKNSLIRLVECDGYGYSFQRNIGAREAKGEYVLYLSGDAYAGKNLIRRYLLTISQGYDVVQGSIINVDDGRLFGRLMKNIYRIIYQKRLKNCLEEFSTVNVLVRRQLILDDPFDESIKSFEDKEWFMRVYQNISYLRLQGAVVYHHIHENFKQYSRKIYREAIAVGQIVRQTSWEQAKKECNFFYWPGLTALMTILFMVNCILTVGLVRFNSPLWLPLTLWVANLLLPLGLAFKSMFSKQLNIVLEHKSLMSLLMYHYYILIIVGVFRGYVFNKEKIGAN